jgi:RNA polymerase sigma factor (sigma-70 family)
VVLHRLITMEEREPLISDLREGHRRFLELVDSVRPELHRYCARMTGSVTDGEDVVQDTLASAYYALSEMEEIPALRPWLFRIAHNRALDFLRRYDRRMGEPLADDLAAADVVDPDDALARDEALRAAIWRFGKLPPLQRSCVVLKDVLDHTLEEIAALLDQSVPAIKAALHRGRARLRALGATVGAPVPPRSLSPTVARYAALFNARDWDGVRAMLLDDVRLDVVSRAQRTGRRQVGEYITNYARVTDWHLVPGWLDGREVLAVFRDPQDARPSYFVELTLADGRIGQIRDFRFVSYVVREATIELASPLKAVHE